MESVSEIRRSVTADGILGKQGFKRYRRSVFFFFILNGPSVEVSSRIVVTFER